MNYLTEERHVLQRPGAVEAVLAVEGGNRGRGRPYPEDRPRDVPRQEMAQDEHDERYAEDDDERLADPADDIADHLGKHLANVRQGTCGPHICLFG